jgi:hypothetical protein
MDIRWRSEGRSNRSGFPDDVIRRVSFKVAAGRLGLQHFFQRPGIPEPAERARQGLAGVRGAADLPGTGEGISSGVTLLVDGALSIDGPASARGHGNESNP